MVSDIIVCLIKGFVLLEWIGLLVSIVDVIVPFISFNFFDFLCLAALMATVPGPLIWEIVKKNNAFLVKQFGNDTAMVQFSKEPNNLYNVNSYKHSGGKLVLGFIFVPFF